MGKVKAAADRTEGVVLSPVATVGSTKRGSGKAISASSDAGPAL